MLCAHCGSLLDPSLFEDGLAFCRVCNHRTRLSDGQDDLVPCPICGQMRDRTAMNCRWCGGSFEDTERMTRSQIREIFEFVRQGIAEGKYNSVKY